jgi:hypothetical protein
MGKQYAVYASSLSESPQKERALKAATQYFEKSADLRASYTDGLFGLLMMEGLEGHRMSDYSYVALTVRLSESPFSNNNYNQLHSVFSCLEGGYCTLPRSKVEGLINACLRNPGFSGKYKSQVLNRYQDYLR